MKFIIFLAFLLYFVAILQPGTYAAPIAKIIRLKQPTSEQILASTPPADTTRGVSIDPLIANGWTAQPGQFPFASAVKILAGGSCSGSLIQPSIVLTNAHCVVSSYRDQTTNTLSALLAAPVGSGTINRSALPYIAASEIYVPNYLQKLKEYDLALLRLVSPIKDVELMTIPPWKTNIYNASIPNNYTIAGWGRQSESPGPYTPNLQYAHVPLIPYDECLKRVKEERGPTYELPPNNICFGMGQGKDGKLAGGCSGDSGAPVFSYNYRSDGKPTLIGMHTWRFTSSLCGTQNKTGIRFAMDISSHSAWISDTLSLFNLRGDITRKNTMDDYKEYAGTIIKTAPTSRVGKCCDACRDDPVCKFWSYSTTLGSCQLFSNTTGSKFNRDVISGRF